MENKLSSEKLAEVKGIGKDLKAQGVTVDNSPVSSNPSPSPTPPVASSGDGAKGIQNAKTPGSYRPYAAQPKKSQSKTKGRSL